MSFAFASDEMILLSKKHLFGAALAFSSGFVPAQAAEEIRPPSPSLNPPHERLSPEREARIRAAYTTELSSNQEAAVSRLSPEQRETIVADAIEAERQAVLLHQQKLASLAGEAAERDLVLEALDASRERRRHAFNWQALFPATRISDKPLEAAGPKEVENIVQSPAGPASPVVMPAAASLESRLSKDERLGQLVASYRADKITAEQYQTERARILAEPE